MTRNFLPIAAVLLAPVVAPAQSPAPAPASQADPKPGEEAGLSTGEEEAIEAELRQSLPTLAPLGNPERLKQLWELARKLTMRRAYCRATQQLEAIEAMTGAITENRSSAAQAFYMCARTRLAQGFVAEAAAALQRSMNIVGERPEHRDLLFKLAVVRAKESMNQGDIVALERNLDEARQFGAELGPGGGNRLASWARPILYETAGEVAGWSRDLLEVGDRKLAERAASLALEYDATNRIASGVQREIIMRTGVLPAVLAAVGMLLLAAMVWRVVRSQQVKRAAAMEDDELEEPADSRQDDPEDTV